MTQRPEPQYAIIDLTELKENRRNARAHSAKQIAQISASIVAFGFTNPLLIDENRQIIAGHGRFLAARDLGLSSVPAIVISYLTAAEKRALAIADNKIALNSSWDLTLLSEELEGLSDPDLALDVSITGFDTAEIDQILDGGDAPPRLDPADRLPKIDRSKPSITQPGDLWVVGAHRIQCGNSLDPASYVRLMGDEKARMVITDPPYNVKIDGHASGLGRVQHAEFAMASGEMTSAQFTAFLKTVMAHMIAHSENGSIHYIFMDWRHLMELLTAGYASYTAFKNLCVWNKTNGGMGSLYRSKHELVAVFKNGKAPHVNNIDLGRQGRYRTNVWDYAGANSLGRARKSEFELHPTVKPIGLVSDAIKDCSHRNDLILDPFGGVGTTIMAAERTGRRARIIELDPYYVDATVKRWEKLTGERAERVAAPAPITEAGAGDANSAEAKESDKGAHHSDDPFCGPRTHRTPEKSNHAEPTLISKGRTRP